MALSREEIAEIAKETAKEILVSRLTYHDPETVEQGIQESMGEELQASMWYQLRARNARISGKTEIAELYSEIARDENQHYEEMTAALKKLEKEEQYVRSEKMTVNGHSS